MHQQASQMICRLMTLRTTVPTVVGEFACAATALKYHTRGSEATRVIVSNTLLNDNQQ
jgi:hypothetical protein